MSFGRSAALVFLGVILGVSLTIGAYYGVREYAPDLASRYIGRLLGISPRSEGTDSGSATRIDSAMVKGIIQDILASEQGKAVMWDLVQSQSKETLDAFLKEAMKSPEFRQALAQALGTFLSSPEGKALLKRIASEVLTP